MGFSAAPKAVAAFDLGTGQIYSETHAWVSSRQHSDWIGKLKTPSLAQHPRPNVGPGARPLAAMATIQLSQHFRELSAEHFASVPWSLAKSIWKQVLTTHRESFHTWRVFATAYPDEMATAANRYHLQIRQPSLALDSYFNGIRSDSAHWLTCLRISPKETRTADLVLVANIHNLAILDLSDGQIAIDTKTSSFDERMMRSWAEIAQRRKGFLHLRVLMLGWQDVGTWLFKYLPCFPALSRVVITDSQDLTQRNRKEWEPSALSAGYEARHAKKSAKSLRPVFDEPDFERCAVAGLLFEEIDKVKQSDDTPLAGMYPHHPVLECWLGTPRKWTHILEDFPGTRTVYFDRTTIVEPLYNFFHDTTQSKHENYKRGRHLGPKSGKMQGTPYQRSAHPTPRARKNIPGLADILNQMVEQE